MEKANALELYSIVYSECRSHTGLILDVEDQQILLLDEQGEFFKLPREAIKTILIYNTVENPLRKIDLNHEQVVLPRKVTIQGQHGNGGSQDRKRQNDQHVGAERRPGEDRHAKQRHALGTHSQDGDEEVDPRQRGPDTRYLQCPDPIVDPNAWTVFQLR